MSLDETQLKTAAAESAAARVSDGMVIGLGTGSTAKLVVAALGRRVSQGLRIIGIPTSEQTAAQARELGIPLSTIEDHPEPDLTIDGADEIEAGTLDLVKGRGGALLREKIVAHASRQLLIVAHDAKLVEQLAHREVVPVEVVPFGWTAAARQLEALGARTVLRAGKDGQPFATDGGHYILDCSFADPGNAAELAEGIDHVVGAVEHGLFIGMTTEVHLAGADGVRILSRRS